MSSHIFSESGFIVGSKKDSRSTTSSKTSQVHSEDIIYHTKSSLPPAPDSGGLLLLRRAAFPHIKATESFWNRLWIVTHHSALQGRSPVLTLQPLQWCAKHKNFPLQLGWTRSLAFGKLPRTYPTFSYGQCWEHVLGWWRLPWAQPSGVGGIDK